MEKKAKIFDKYTQMSVQAKSAIWFTMCSILQKGIAFITVPIFTRLMTDEQYGTYSLYLSWLQILTIITSLYLYYGVFNNAMVKFEDDRNRYISSMQGLTMTITATVFGIYLVFQKMWVQLLGLTPTLIILMFIEMLVTPSISFWAGRQRFEYKYQRLVAVTLGKSIANPLLGLIAVYFANDKVTARIASIVIVEVAFCSIIIVKQFADGRCFFVKKYWKYALGLAIPLLPHYLSSMILNQGDRIMIDKLAGRSEVAFYSVAYSIGMLVQIFTNAISNSFTPWVYQKIKKNDYAEIAKIINALLMLVGVIVFSLMLCGPELVWLFGSEEYASATFVIPPVAASVFFIFLYNILALPQFYFEKTQFLLFSSITAALVNVGLNYIFIRIFGYVAAGYTTLVCYVLYSIGHWIVSKRVMSTFIPGKILFNSRMILAISVLVITAGILCNFLFDYWYIRYGILFGGAVLAIIKKDDVIKLLRSVKEK
ncbi:lipopolysaccharide biosynthesis protein [Brotaphodocola sp.]|uniref:lipopolysaccharide biosynthesis protein n=1 Tax=Brotaphodocola sp. TaxID=3073577 RepID=UPI003D7E8E24